MILLAYLFLILFGWIAAIALASLLAIIPFFLLGFAGKASEMLALRKQKKALEKRKLRLSKIRAEVAQWRDAEQSRESLLETFAEAMRRAG